MGNRHFLNAIIINISHKPAKINLQFNSRNFLFNQTNLLFQRNKTIFGKVQRARKFLLIMQEFLKCKVPGYKTEIACQENRKW